MLAVGLNVNGVGIVVVGIVGCKVISVNLVDIAVSIVVDIVAWHLIRILPHAWVEVLVVVVHARVYDCHDHLVIPGGDVPGQSRVDVRPRYPFYP